MRHRILFPLLCLLSSSLLLPRALAAPHPGRTPEPQRQASLGVFTETLSVRVRIVDGVATTTMEQTVRNTTARQAEATWVLPLPPGAVADGFQMLMNGKPTSGEVLGAEQARGVYEGIVRRQQDPGLLEYMGRGCLRARIFPIPPHGTTQASVSFRHVLPRESGLLSWSVAARAAGVGGRPPQAIQLDFSVEDRHLLKNAYSPHPALQVIQPDDHTVRASFEGKADDLPAGDLTVFYGRSEKDFGLDLLTYPDETGGDPAGTFLMLLAPKRDWKDVQVTRKAITFVLDTSGSMNGVKMQQAVASLRIFLGSLHAEDFFNVVPFATEPEPFFEVPVPASKENVEAALARLQGLRAIGGTNLAGALSAGLRVAPDTANHVPILVLMTDGQPTVGVTDPASILAQVSKAPGLANRGDNVAAGTRIFVLGVGYDVNTLLLDRLAEATRGRPDYVAEGDDIELRTGSLFAKLSNPVLTDLAIAVDGIELTRTAPSSLPDLFEGETLEYFGRYRGKGPRAIRLTGRLQGKDMTFVYEGTFAGSEASASALDFLPSLWAERRVGILLDAIRLNGENAELVAEVERLGRQHHIVTPYTSHLIIEEGLQVAAGNRPSEVDLRALEALGYSDSSGAGGSDAFFLGRGARSSPSSAPAAPERRKELAGAIRLAGILPEDSPESEVDELAVSLDEALQSGADDLAGLSKGEASGEQAVQRSLYLRRLRESGATDRDALLGLFSKHVKNKTFLLRSGRWTDSSFDPQKHAITVELVAFSTAYFEYLKAKPGLAPYLTIGQSLLVVLGDQVISIEPSEAGAGASISRQE